MPPLRLRVVHAVHIILRTCRVVIHNWPLFWKNKFCNFWLNVHFCFRGSLSKTPSYYRDIFHLPTAREAILKKKHAFKNSLYISSRIWNYSSFLKNLLICRSNTLRKIHHILQQICHLFHILEKKPIFCLKSTKIFFRKRPNFVRF